MGWVSFDIEKKKKKKKRTRLSFWITESRYTFHVFLQQYALLKESSRHFQAEFSILLYIHHGISNLSLPLSGGPGV